MAFYGLAMEYKSLERWDDAVSTFEKLRSLHPDYVAMYLMCGEVLGKLGKPDDARAWYEAGVVAARKKGDSHALGELESALAGL